MKEINKSLGAGIEFFGFRAQYIIYIFICIIGVYALNIVLFLCGVPLSIILITLIPSGVGIGFYFYKLSQKHGQFGLLKLSIRKKLPSYLVFREKIVIK